MNVYIQELRSDHRRLSRLLRYIQENLPGERARWQPDRIRAMRQCIEYICSYSVVVHHDKEDVLFRRLAARDESARVYIDVLTAEHRLLTHNAEHLRRTVRLVEDGKAAYGRVLGKSARAFISAKLRHMRLEEDTVFPLLENRLTLEDWKSVITDMPPERDPLSVDDRSEAYAPLRSLVMAPAERVG